MKPKKALILIVFGLFFIPLCLMGQNAEILIHSPKNNDIWHGTKLVHIQLKGITLDTLTKGEIYIDGKLAKEFTSLSYKFSYNFGSRLKYRTMQIIARGIKGVLAKKEIHSLDVDDYQEVSVSQIVIPVVVTDGNNNYIKTLKKEDFTLKVDGLPQKISHFSKSGKSRFNMILLIDISSSMKDKIGAVKEAAKFFLNQLLTKENRAMVVFFNHEVFEDTEFTNDISTLNNSINMAYPFGATALYDAISYCYKLLKGVPGHNIIIIFSDGEDNSSHIDPYTLINKVEKSNNIVYSIGNDAVNTDVQYQVILNKFASISG